MYSIPESYELVKSQIAQSAAKCGRGAGEIELVAVSKTWPVEIISELVSCGHTVFGENKVQELEVKAPALPAGLRWHFIGHLQKNKVRKVLPLADTIHSVDSLELARRIDHIAADLGLFPKVYLQANTAGESAKSGFSPQQIAADIDDLLDLERLEILGLMGIPPVRENPDDTRGDFRALRELRDKLQTQTGVPLPGLSMGMSHDFELAIAEGSTAVRVGSSIFGKRRVPMG